MVLTAIWLLRCILFAVLLYSLSAAEDNKKAGQQSPIPLLSVSLNSDRFGYLTRLIMSIDYPVKQLLIQIGSSNVSDVHRIAKRVRKLDIKRGLVGEIRIRKLWYNPGSSKGFNFGLNALLENTSRDAWVFCVNNDISFFPNTLGHIAKQVERAMANDPLRFGLGFTDLANIWSAVIFTKKAAQIVGKFDENFYPAYYEDDDYAIRFSLTNLTALRFKHTPMMHGEMRGSAKYVSGIYSNLFSSNVAGGGSSGSAGKGIAQHIYSDAVEMTMSDLNRWRKTHNEGVNRSREHLEKKWGIKVGFFSPLGEWNDVANATNCKSFRVLRDHSCRPMFTHPFNDSKKRPDEWTLPRKPLWAIAQTT